MKIITKYYYRGKEYLRGKKRSKFSTDKAYA